MRSLSLFVLVALFSFGAHAEFNSDAFEPAGTYIEASTGAKIEIGEDRVVKTNFIVEFFGARRLYFPRRVRQLNEYRYFVDGYFPYKSCKAPVRMEFELLEDENILLVDIQTPSSVVEFLGCSWLGERKYYLEMEGVE